MPRIDFRDMPDDARLWVFGIGRSLTDAERAEFLERVDDFLSSWAAHGAPLTCARDLRRGRFLLVAVDEASIPPSGCSIDAMVHVLKDAERRFEAPIVDNTPVWYLDGEDVRRVTRSTFRALADDGRVSVRTVVFDNTVTRVADVRDGRWERPAEESWHARAFFRDQVPS